MCGWVLAPLTVLVIHTAWDANADGTKPRKKPEVKKAQLGKGVWFETEGDRRRVLVEAVVCYREGDFGLECLLCRKETKEHESILSTEAEAKVIHAGLIAAGARPGSTVVFIPQFKAPAGSRINVSVRFDKEGKTVTLPAQQWVRDVKNKKDMEVSWVFAGSVFYDNPDGKDKPPLYGADIDGAYICTTNVPTAMLDLPLNSPKGLDDRMYAPHTERIPPLQTKVTVILEPVLEK